MKYSKYLKLLAVSLTVALLVALVPVTPALGAAYLRLSPDSGKVGDEVEVWGAGFSAGIQLKFFFSDERASVADRIGVDVINYDEITDTASTGTTGSFEEVFFDVPNRLRDGEDIEDVRGGTYYIYATDYNKDILARIEFTVESVAEITIDPDDGPVGTAVDITGQGFGSREDIIVEFDNNEVDIKSGDEDTDTDGEFSCTILVPESTAGDHTITVTGDDSNIDATDTFTVEPEITLSATSGVAGETITVSGTGFGDRADFIIWFGNQEVVDDRTDSDGSFEENFTIPAIGAGTYDIEVVDDENNNAEAEFSVATAAITINPTTGHVNAQVTVSGTGFQASKTISITFDNEEVASVTSGGQGKVNTTFIVPVRGAGTYVVKVSDGTNTAQASFTITTSVSISPQTSASSPGYIGTGLTISGVGYVAGTQVTVTYDGTAVTTTTVNTDGSFTASFDAPVSKGGQHTVIANIGTAAETFTFFIETTPPSTIFPKLPLMSSELEDWRFDWCGDAVDLSKEVTDDSLPVTYTLQIATSADFSPGSIVFTKTGLAQSEYTLTEDERLESTGEENPYYWRVKAIDNAFNEGTWSGTGEFYVAGGISWGLPKPVIYLLIALGVVAVIVLGFWLGRKTAYY